MACASTVAVVVPSPAVSDVLLATSRTIWAPMFSSASGRSISFATVTPSLVIVGDPNFLSMMTLRPRGPSVTFTASARLLTPRRMPCREASPYTICFAIPYISRRSGVSLRWSVLLFLRRRFRGRRRGGSRRGGRRRRRAVVEDAEHFVLAQNQVLL